MRVYSAHYEDDAHLTTIFDGGFKSIQTIGDTKDIPGILVLHGGSDISPSLYNEKTLPVTLASKIPSQRDEMEMQLIKDFTARKWPIFGICRGMQMLTAAFGGKLLQHVSNHAGGDHRVSVMVRKSIENATGKIQSFTDFAEFEVNSAHHQMCVVRKIRDAEVTSWCTTPRSGVYVGASSPEDYDIEVEAVHFRPQNCYGVQWHPEWLKKDHVAVQWLLTELSSKITRV